MEKLLKETFQNKKIFLTGHTGFKGSWLLKILNLLGAEVQGYSLLPGTKPNLYSTLNGDQLCKSIIGDIRDIAKLKKNILDFKPDFIFHLAAQPLVQHSFHHPSETFETNISGTVNLLEAIRAMDRKCTTLIITTDKVYKNNEWDYPYREIDELGGNDPYSASKSCCEIVVNSYRTSFFRNSEIGLASCRAGNVIGGGDWSENRLVPDLIKSLKNKKEILIRNPSAIRPWQHVLEPIFGYLILAQKLMKDPVKFSQSYNFGPTSESTVTVEEIVSRTIQIWGDKDQNLKVSKFNNLYPESRLLTLDISKAKNDLDWQPRMNLNEALCKTIDWYQSYYMDSNKSILKLTEGQILDYMNL